MEATAGGIAIVSLALQLIHTVDTIKTFVRDVKSAPTELKRISQTLDALHATLDDVRRVLEYQTSRLGQRVPPPSATISDSLRRCEDHLQPLKKIVDESASILQNPAQRAKLWDKIRFSFKGKDIAEFENRIEKEKTTLIAALATNNTLIQLHMLPGMSMYVTEQITRTTLTHTDLCLPPQGRAQIDNGNLSQHILTTTDTQDSHSLPNPHVFTKTEYTRSNVTLGLDNSESRYIRRRFQLDSPLRRFGIQKHKLVLVHKTESSGQQHKEEDIICEEMVYTWASSFFRYGAQWSSSGPFGSVAPALRTYPVVESLDDFCWDLMIEWSLEEVKTAFKSRKLHPFMQDYYGNTLLHQAAECRRVDICQLLVALGVGNKHNHWGELPFQNSTDVDTARFLISLPESDSYDDSKAPFNYFNCSYELTSWIWTNTTELFGSGPDPGRVRSSCLEVLNGPKYIVRFKELLLHSATSSNKDCQTFLRSPQAVEMAFCTRTQEEEGFAVGDVIVEFLLKSGVDMEEWKESMCAVYPDGVIASYRGRPQRRLVIERTPPLGWKLGWEWALNPKSHGYLVVAEFKKTAIEVWEGEWPYYSNRDLDYDDPQRQAPKWEKRFQRREEKKAQKKLRRSGQKLIRSKMPGSWIH